MWKTENIESCLKYIGALGQEIMPQNNFILEINEPSRFTVVHAVLLLVLNESVHLLHVDVLMEF